MFKIEAVGSISNIDPHLHLMLLLPIMVIVIIEFLQRVSFRNNGIAVPSDSDIDIQIYSRYLPAVALRLCPDT